MKAEDIERLWNASSDVNDGYTISGDLHQQFINVRSRLERFARACEQHGIERAKALASATCLHECRECGGEGYDECADDDGDCGQCKGSGDVVDKVAIDWSALDAEIAKENET